MSAWRKSPPELIEFFYAALPNDPAVERRKMFGYPCAFVNGQMFTGMHQESMIVRLGEADRTKLLREAGAAIFEPMPGRPMREYVALPPTMTTGDGKAAKGWMGRSLAYASSLPAKKPKASSPKKATKTAAPRKKS